MGLLIVIIIANNKNDYYQEICASVLIAVLFTTARIWGEPECPPMDEGIKKM